MYRAHLASLESVLQETATTHNNNTQQLQPSNPPSHYQQDDSSHPVASPSLEYR